VAKFPGEVPLILVVPRFPYNTVSLKESSRVTKNDLCLVVSLQYRLVTDILKRAHYDSICRAVKTDIVNQCDHISQLGYAGFMWRVCG